MDYFYLKVGIGNAQARDWLAGKNPPNLLNRPAAPIYFDNYNLADYKAGKGGKEPRLFWERGKPEFYEKTRMVVVHEGEIWILKPDGEVDFLLSEPNELGNPHTPKAMPVKILKHRVAKDVPPVLASITANQYLTRGTFRQISDWGNYKAIDCMVGGPYEGEHWVGKQGPAQLFECLGSIELETLVAKLLEAYGCFVPAYRGGLMKDIDLFGYNDGDTEINIGSLKVPPKERVSLQIKRWSNGMTKPASVDYLVGLDVKGKDAFNADWILDQIKKCPPVIAWLRRSLNWLPTSFLSKFSF
jgi:hypothetical protein